MLEKRQSKSSAIYMSGGLLKGPYSSMHRNAREQIERAIGVY